MIFYFFVLKRLKRACIPISLRHRTFSSFTTHTRSSISIYLTLFESLSDCCLSLSLVAPIAFSQHRKIQHKNVIKFILCKTKLSSCHRCFWTVELFRKML